MKKHKKSSSKKKHRQDDKTTNAAIDNQEKDHNADIPYITQESKTMGRYLVASKTLKAGDIVLKEEPIAVGPCQESEPLCIGCYKNIDLQNSQTYQRCSKCNWPLCTFRCPGNNQKFGHSSEECEILSKSQIKNASVSDFKQFYYAVMPFRCLIIRGKNPGHWKVVQNMEPHTEERRKNVKLWEMNKRLAVDVIRDVWGLKNFTEDEIHFMCGILEVNAFEVNLSEPGRQCLRAIYPTAFLFAHDCIPNTCHSNNDEFELTVRTIRNIPSREIITVSYAYTLQSTLKRRKHIKETKFFSCSCRRCSDPTELGTNIGAMRCSNCQQGHLLPKNPLDEDSVWKCSNHKCSFEVQVSLITPILEKYFKELDSIDGNDIISYEKFVKKCSSIFHDNHYLILSALHCLSQLYGKIDGYLINNLSDEQLERKEEICRQLIKVFEKLEPGLSKQRGLLLYELQAPLMVMIRRKFERQNIPKKEMRMKIKEVLKYLEEADLILSHEPENSAENKMADAAKEGIASLQSWLSLIN